MAQAISGMRISVMPGARILKIVTMKLIAPKIDEKPTNWSAIAQMRLADRRFAGSAAGRPSSRSPRRPRRS